MFSSATRPSCALINRENRSDRDLCYYYYYYHHKINTFVRFVTRNEMGRINRTR